MLREGQDCESRGSPRAHLLDAVGRQAVPGCNEKEGGAAPTELLRFLRGRHPALTGLGQKRTRASAYLFWEAAASFQVG
jgi:hypothetical protein